MKTKFFFVVSATMLLTACNSNDEVVTSFDDDTPQVSNEFAMSNEEAKDVLNIFVNGGATTRYKGKQHEFPIIVDYVESLIALTSDQHLRKAHPAGKLGLPEHMSYQQDRKY